MLLRRYEKKEPKNDSKRKVKKGRRHGYDCNEDLDKLPTEECGECWPTRCCCAFNADAGLDGKPVGACGGGIGPGKSGKGAEYRSGGTNEVCD